MTSENSLKATSSREVKDGVSRARFDQPSNTGQTAAGAGEKGEQAVTPADRLFGIVSTSDRASIMRHT